MCPMDLQVTLQAESSPSWDLGWILGFVALSTTKLWLMALTYQQFGWRVHSRMDCDYRRKHADFKQQMYFQINW